MNNLNKKVVKIICDFTQFDPNIPFFKKSNKGHGTGFFINNKGLILTCSHVIKDATNVIISIYNNENYYKAKILGMCIELDIALLQIDYNSKDYLKFGNSKNLKLGDEVYAVGYPGTYTKNTQLKFNKGIISGSLGENIMTDTPINSGNSGGPLILKNKVIGINIASLIQKQNMNIAVPIHLFQNLKKTFLSKEIMIPKPFLPLCFNSTNLELSPPIEGVYIYNNMNLIKIPCNSLLTKIDNYNIDNSGTINLKWFNNRTSIQNYILQKPYNSIIKLQYYDLTTNKKHTMNYKLKPIYLTIRDLNPIFENINYTIIGGGIFQELNLNFIKQNEVFMIKFMNYLELINRNKSVVVLTYIFSNSILGKLNVLNEGNIITKCNDKQIKSFQHFKTLLQQNKFNVIKLENEISETVFLNMTEATKNNKNLIKELKI